MPRANKRRAKKDLLRELAADRGWEQVSDQEWADAREAIPDLNTRDVRHSSLAFTPPWGGVSLHSYEDLAKSLTELAHVYDTRPDLRSFCRNEVIKAKDLARILSGKHADKAEMAEWMLIWLSDPSLFPTWIHVRMRWSDE